MSVRSNAGMESTSTLSRPSSGIRFLASRPSSSVSSGSISITISSPGRTTVCGMDALEDLSSEPSSTSVGMATDLPGIVTLYVSDPFR